MIFGTQQCSLSKVGYILEWQQMVLFIYSRECAIAALDEAVFFLGRRCSLKPLLTRHCICLAASSGRNASDEEWFL